MGFQGIPPARLATGRRRVRWSYVTLFAVIVSAAIVGLPMAPVGAHSAMIDASPAPDETVGGTIDIVELAFNEPVSEAVITVSYNEEPLAGVTTMTEGEIIRFELDDALEVPGRYEVSFEMISSDTDYTTSAFFFTYEADAPQPAQIGETDRVGLTSGDSGGTSRILIGAMAILLATVFGLLAIFVWRVDARRRRDTLN
ncbi:MAG: hypothetical protein GY724_26155 [Actinomycetia bacterium]|nr:hypothetical protein [Actinomycetes bacterium]MCP4227141.1 hypothetical protein [Actinomycetes bacterium]MCP5035537.1 hypothetical protein [Actinomycetes bacterium]